MRALLLPFSYLYGAGVAIRNLFFDIGILKTQRVSVPVISVGNISVGGVGKTPFVELLARRFSQQGRKVAIISRGYKRVSGGILVVSNGSVVCADADAAGDEPAQLASKLRGVIVIVDEQRVRGARHAIQHFGAGIVILDDGFQHRYLHRDLNIVIASTDEVLLGDRLLPAGNRREPLSALQRADIIVVSRCDDEEHFHRAEQRLRDRFDKPLVGMQIRVSAFKKASSGFSVDLRSLSGKRVVAFSGIGNPEGFETTLASLKLDVKKHLIFADHHRFTSEDVKSVEDSARKAQADYIVTTEKDAARLSGSRSEVKDFVGRNPVYYVEIEQNVIAGEQELTQALARF